ncbi:MAG: TM2 domain-containing protein [Chthonomonadales bacterium]
MPYSIIGGDGNQYGPVEVNVLVQWAREGRIVPTTGIVDHDHGRNFLAKDLAELAPIFAPPPPHSGRMTAARQPLPVPHYTYVPGMRVDAYGRPLKNRWVAGLLAIFFGIFGVHRFYLGYSGIGTVQLLMCLLSPFTCFISLAVVIIWSFIDGIICFAGGMTDSYGNPLIT